MSEVDAPAPPVDAPAPAETDTPPVDQTALGVQPPVDQAPAEPQEYSVEIDGFNFDEFKAIPENAELLTRAKDAGLSNEQVSFMLKEYNDILPKLVSENSALNTEDAIGQLKETWGKDYDTSIQNAAKALKSAGFTDEDLSKPEIGNNVALAKLAAHFGAQMKEDATPLNAKPSTVSASEHIKGLMMNPAYNNPNDPMYASIKQQVADFYAKGGKLND